MIAATARTPDRMEFDDRSYGLPTAHVSIQLRADGSADVVERITFDFVGSFTGAFRDIPMRRGDKIDHVVVCDAVDGIFVLPRNMKMPDVHNLSPRSARIVIDEYASAYSKMNRKNANNTRCPAGMKSYIPGASTELGSNGIPGSFGTKVLKNPHGDDEQIPRVKRIVWHFDAGNELREFTISYRTVGTIRRSGSSTNDPLVVNATPWGSEWKSALGQLTVEVHLPTGATADVKDIDAWVAARGAARTSSSIAASDTSQAPASIQATASQVTQGERVDLLALIPAATSGIKAPKKLPKSFDSPDSLRTEARDAVRANERRSNQLAIFVEPQPLLWPTLAALMGLLIAGVCIVIAWFRALREDPWPEEVPRLLSNPPSELTPALAASLVEQRDDASPNALVATVFDLVRRKAFSITPAQGNRKGVQVDIALAKADRSALTFNRGEAAVLKLIDMIIGKDAVAMGEFRNKLRRNLKLSKKVATQESIFNEDINHITK